MKYSCGKQSGENYIAIAIIIIVSIPFWLPIMAYTVDKFYFTPTRNIENCWDIDVPSDFKQIYHVSSDSIYAKGDGYTVYETGDDISNFIDKFYYANEPVVEKYVKEIMAGLSVPKNYHPLFDKPYYYIMHKSYGGDKLVIAYFPGTNRCFFVESFSWDK